MSWYYAGKALAFSQIITPLVLLLRVSGYYTGLYEGKQQGLHQAELARKGS